MGLGGGPRVFWFGGLGGGGGWGWLWPPAARLDGPKGCDRGACPRVLCHMPCPQAWALVACVGGPWVRTTTSLPHRPCRGLGEGAHWVGQLDAPVSFQRPPPPPPPPPPQTPQPSATLRALSTHPFLPLPLPRVVLLRATSGCCQTSCLSWAWCLVSLGASACTTSCLGTPRTWAAGATSTCVT